MKKIFAAILSFVMCLWLLVGCAGTKNPNDNTNGNDNFTNANENENDNFTNENVVIGAFLDYAKFDSDGIYRFREYNDLYNVSFSYCFAYDPSLKLYNGNILVTSYTYPKMYDYAAVTFSWGNFTNGLFYAYHELDSIAKIEFEYKNLSFNNHKTLGSTYSYKVKSNSFNNLNNKADIDEYAATSYDALQQAISYMNSVFFDLNISINLF